MPRGDGTGPLGRGPMSGRGAGFCAGFGFPGYDNAFPGRRFGMGFGRSRGFDGGRGRRNRFPGAGMRERGCPGNFRAGDAEKVYLARRADALQSELDLIRNRLAEMEAGPNKEQAGER